MTDEIQKQVHEALNEIKQTVETKTKDVVTEEKFNKLKTEVLNLTEKAQTSERENIAIKAALQASGVSDNKDGLSDQEKKYQELAEAFIRKGEGEHEIKAMGAYSSQDGGITVPKIMLGKIVKRIFETSPVRAVASVATITSDSAEFYIDDDEKSANWVSEAESRTETDTAKLNKKTIAVHEQYAEPRVTQRLLDDSSFNIESWVADKVADKFARTENTAFVKGDGAGKPRGFLTYSAGSSTYNIGQIQQVNLGASTALTGAGLIKLQKELKGTYDGGASWMMKRSTYGDLLQLMYTDNKFNALTAGGINGAPFLLLGKPVNLADDIPAVVANALSVVYGNFAEAYQIIDRQGVNLIRDPYTAKPFVKFYFTKRVGGDVMNTEAIKIGKIAS